MSDHNAYPDWVKETVLEIYRQGLNTYQVETLTGIPETTVWRWCKKAGITRSHSVATEGAFAKEFNSQWKGDDAGYKGQHKRAVQDFPHPLGTCQICLAAPAVERARIDHSNLPYRKEYVLPMCRSCNTKHDMFNRGTRMHGDFVILFKEIG